MITKTDLKRILSLLNQCEKLSKEDKIYIREIGRKAKILKGKLNKTNDIQRETRPGI